MSNIHDWPVLKRSGLVAASGRLRGQRNRCSTEYGVFSRTSSAAPWTPSTPAAGAFGSVAHAEDAGRWAHEANAWPPFEYPEIGIDVLRIYKRLPKVLSRGRWHGPCAGLIKSRLGRF